MREALSLPLRRSRLGSLPEGAAEQSEAEGVRYEIWEHCKNTHDTPSVSPFGLPAPPEVEPGALRAAIRHKKGEIRYEKIPICHPVPAVGSVHAPERTGGNL